MRCTPCPSLVPSGPADRLSLSVRPQTWVAALVVGALLGGCGWRPASGPAGPSVPLRPLTEGSARATLGRLAQAIEARDPGTARGLASPDSPRTRAHLAVLVRQAREAGIREVDLEIVTTHAAPAGGLRVRARLQWRFSRHGRHRLAATLPLTMVPSMRPPGARITSLGDRGAPIWLARHTEVRRRPGVLVMARTRPAAADRYADWGSRALATLRRRLPARSRPDVVIVVPRNRAELAAQLGGSISAYRGIAAVTANVAPGINHVFVNRSVIGRGRSAVAVVTHETVHANTDAPASRAPIWLIEGYADDVALSEVAGSKHEMTVDLVAHLRRHGMPHGFPAPGDFAGAGPGAQAAYQGAWLACRIIALRRGPAALDRLYRLSSDGVGLDAAMRRSTGRGRSAWLRSWRRVLRSLASARRSVSEMG